MRPSLSDYKLLSAGKVRELYEIDEKTLLMVASDRISAYDHVLSTPIPDKGRILTAMSMYFFDRLALPNQLAGDAHDERIPEAVLGSALVVNKLEMVPVECVARGYLTGSGLADYKETGAVCGVTLPEGLVEASRLPEPIFTPARKAPAGSHDENITFDQVVDMVGPNLAVKLRDDTIDIYSRASMLAADHGVLIADTKFEFGTDTGGNLVLADEVLTSDSSRFWWLDDYAEGRTQPSLDKQYVRDWLTGEESGWDRGSDSPPPPLPQHVVDATRSRYIEAYETLSGLSFDDWPGDR